MSRLFRKNRNNAPLPTPNRTDEPTDRRPRMMRKIERTSRARKHVGISREIIQIRPSKPFDPAILAAIGVSYELCREMLDAMPWPYGPEHPAGTREEAIADLQELFASAAREDS